MTTKTKKKSKVGSGVLHFSVDGDFLTETARDTWVSDLPKKAVEILVVGLIGMPQDLAIEIITGKKKLVGNSNDGITVEDDNVTEVCGIGLSVETMEKRLLQFYIETMESINVFKDVDLKDYRFIEWEEIEESTEKNLNYYKEKLKGIIEQLDFIFSLTGKTLKDLPMLDVRSAKQLKDEAKEQFEKVQEEEEERQQKEEKDSIDINQPFETNIIGSSGKFYIVHTPPEKCKEEAMHSGWLLPDGTFFAGSSAWIHRGILDELNEREFFKDKSYTSDEDDGLRYLVAIG